MVSVVGVSFVVVGRLRLRECRVAGRFSESVVGRPASAVSLTGYAKVICLGRRCRGLSVTAGAPTEYPLGS